MNYIKWFRGLVDSQENWAKQLKLGELYVAGFPIPSGFVILPSVNEISEEVEKEIIDAYTQLHASYNVQHLSETAKGLINFGRSKLAVLVKIGDKVIPNISGEDALISTIKEYLSEARSDPVIVQKMVNPSKSGTIQPDTDGFSVKASYGFAGPIIRGQVNADEYTISTEGEIIDKKLGSKEAALILDPNTREIKRIDVDISQRNRFTLSNRELEVIAKLARKLNEYLGPQKIQWAVEGHRVYVLDFEPIEQFRQESEIALPSEIPSQTDSLELPGILPSAQEEKPEPSFRESFLPSRSEESSEPTVSELRSEHTQKSNISDIPIPPSETTESVDTSSDFPLSSLYSESEESKPEPSLYSESDNGFKGEEVQTTGTGVGVMIDMPLYSERAAKTSPDAVLLRLEPLILNAGISPLNQNEYINNITRGVQATLEAFPDKQIHIVLPDIRSDQLDEGLEKNPMLGWHGVRRITSSHVGSELEAIRQAVQASGHRGINLLLPFVTHQLEIKKAEDLLLRSGLTNQVSLGVIIETPAAVHIADLICRQVDLVIVDLDHLTEYLLAVDKNNEKVAEHYDSKHPAVSKALTLITKACKENSVKLYVYGEAVSDPEVVNFLIKNRVAGVLTSAEKLACLRSEIFRAERKLLLDVAADRP